MEKNLDLKVIVPKHLENGKGDEQRITQVILNLLGNAIKFTEQGEIKLEVAVSNNAFLISVTDTGSDSKDVVAGLEAGGDEYLTKPVNHAALVARVKSMLRIKLLHDTVLEQSSQLEKQLKTATKIQSLFWPEIPQLEAGGHIRAVSVPATYVGGDLYDVIPMPDESLLMYVADVSDKGVSAALIMAALSKQKMKIRRSLGMTV